MKKGFTLVELLAMIIILGLIALVVVPAIGNGINKAEDKTITNSTLAYIKGVNDLYSNNVLEPTNPVVVGVNQVSDLNSFIEVKNAPTAGYIILEADKVIQAELCINDTFVNYDDGQVVIDYDRGCGEL